MSGIIDIWTSELAKLKSKGEAVFPSGSAPPTQEAAPVAAACRGLAQAFQFQAKKLTALQCSEASISMLVDTFSA